MLIVDASVVIKWFVDEPLHTEARHILKYQKDILAPEFVLVEVANAVWKKMRRKEIEADQAHAIVSLAFDALPGFIHSPDILRQATEFAIELAHPIYDCLYLACIDEPRDALVTADKRFFNKIKGTRFESFVRFLDDPDLALPLYIALEKLGEIIRISEQFWQTGDHLLNKFLGPNTTGVLNPKDSHFIYDSPTYRNLESQLAQLDSAAIVDVYALGLLGESQGNDTWDKIRPRVENNFTSRVSDSDLTQIINVTRHLEAGFAMLRNQ